ncbi:iron transporter [Halopiger goleimassiliensis]|uniref:iron transporter n=1 Tax=Halopiger goleimassiliensis TaxID=1293048 RepID=UPI000677966C|nr:iron transporter [Halopiger goleimassiliensis]
MRRRRVLAAGGSLLAGLSAGCLETLRREDAWRELVVDPPEGVYVPPHADGMVRYGSATVEGLEASLFASRPHSFWLVSGTERSRADVRSRHDLHLMVAVRDAETGTVVPAPVRTTIHTQAGDRVDERSLWPMLSQRMGVHAGDNCSLEGDGRYAVTVEIGEPSATIRGERSDLPNATSVEFGFEYAADEIEGLERRLFDEDEGRGDPGALEPMAHARDDHDDSTLDEVEGDRTRIGSARVGDVTVVAIRANSTGEEGTALAVGLRTPYNAYPLVLASVSASVVRGDERLETRSLQESVGPHLGHHYRTDLEPAVLERGDALAIDLETPPQVARHEGYETAFLEPETVRLALD